MKKPINMSNPSRILYNFFEGLAISNNMKIEYDENDIYMLDMVCVNYYPNPIINMITSKLKGRKVTQKQLKISYWIKLLQNTFNHNKGAKRPTVVNVVDSDVMKMKYSVINRTLLNDYTITDMYKMFDMINECTYTEIKNACKISKEHGVFNVSYIQAVAKNEHGKSQRKLHTIAKLEKKTKESAERLNTVKVENSTADMAMVHGNWAEAQQNAELERMLEEIERNRT